MGVSLWSGGYRANSHAFTTLVSKERLVPRGLVLTEDRPGTGDPCVSDVSKGREAAQTLAAETTKPPA